VPPLASAQSRQRRVLIVLGALAILIACTVLAAQASRSTASRDTRTADGHRHKHSKAHRRKKPARARKCTKTHAKHRRRCRPKRKAAPRLPAGETTAPVTPPGSKSVPAAPSEPLAPALPISPLQPIFPGQAPTDQTAPSIAGTAIVDQSLTASSGAWSGTSPITFQYRWSDGTEGATDILTQADLGHTLTVTVTATNSVGSSSSTSGPSALVRAQTDCIRAPSDCGYPDATNTGVPAGTALTAKREEITVTEPNTTIEDLALEGAINIEADNTTVKDTRVTVNSGSCGPTDTCGNYGIRIAEGVTGTLIEDTEITTDPGVTVEHAIRNLGGETTTIRRVYMEGADSNIWGAGTIEDSYGICQLAISEDHVENIYDGGGEGALILRHNTLLNPVEQTAVVFTTTDAGTLGPVTLEDNLMAGGGYTIYGGTDKSGSVPGPWIVAGNRFSRKYYPNGGFYGLDAYFNEAVTTWEGNVWDETLEPAAF
jgi:hypothetical protein